MDEVDCVACNHVNCASLSFVPVVLTDCPKLRRPRRSAASQPWSPGPLAGAGGWARHRP